MESMQKSTQKVYNTPLEIGLRMLVILNELGAKGGDLDQIMYFDFLSLNTKDIGGPESIHAPVPKRGVQVYARKNLMQKGGNLLLSKELIDFRIDEHGFSYGINEVGKAFLTYFTSDYFREFSDRVNWVHQKFNNYSSEKLETFINENLSNWGGEFLDDK